MYCLYDGNEFYSVNEKQQITRDKMPNMIPGDQWRALMLVRNNNFGHEVERIPFDCWDAFLASNPRMKYKNGKPIYRLVDYDHGTQRIWGRGVTLSKVT